MTRPRSSRPSAPPRRPRRPGRERSRGAAPRPGVWLHVDAAYAGSAAICPEFRWCLAGVELPTRSSSTRTSGCSRRSTARSLWTRRPEAFRAAFAAHGDYLPADRGRDRPARLRPRARTALPRAEALDRDARYGRSGLQETIREHIRLAARFEEWVVERPRLGARRAEALLDSLFPPSRRRQRRDRPPRDGDRPASSSRRRSSRGLTVIRLAVGNAWDRAKQDVGVDVGVL